MNKGFVALHLRAVSFFAVCFLILGNVAASPAVAQTSEELLWNNAVSVGFRNTQWSGTAEAACLSMDDADLTVGLNYNPSIHDRTEPSSAASSNRPRETCIDDNAKTIDVQLFCVVSEPDGAGGTNYSSWSPGFCPRVVCDACNVKDEGQAATSTPNPIDVRSRIKRKTHTDWRSPREPRFSITRYYRSDDGNRPRLTGNHSGLVMHPGSWRSEFNDSLVEFGQPTATFYGKTGEAIVFDGKGESGVTASATESGNDASILKFRAPTPITIYHTNMRNGTSKNYEFGWSLEDGRLERLFWDDGYEIKIARNSRQWFQASIITVVYDNRGNRAQYTWQALGSTEVVQKIEVDTDYNGTFTPEVEITYLYESNPVQTSMPVLLGVERTDLATGVTETIYEYTYAQDSGTYYYPRLLTSVKDGRLNESGQAFDYEEYTYDLSSQPYVYGEDDQGRTFQTLYPAITSSKAGGVEQYTVGENTITNPLGHVQERTLDYAGIRLTTTGLTETVSPGVQQANVSYDFTPNAGAPEGFVYSRTEKNGAVTTFERDALGRILTQTEDADGLAPRVTTYTWHDDQRLPETRTTEKMSEAFVYDANDLLISYSQSDVDPASPTNGQVRTWTYTYTTLASGLRVVETVDGPGAAADGINDVTTYTYNTDGTLASTTDPNGLVTTLDAYSALGQPTQITQPDGIVWGFTYDIVGRMLTSTRDPGGTPKTTTYTYDVAGQLISMTNTLGRTWTYTYDGARRLMEVRAPNGEKTTYTHDAMGNVTRMAHSKGTGADQFWEDSTYDALGRLTQKLGARSQVTSFAHDVENNLDNVTDPIGKTIDNSFDALNRVVAVIDKANFTTFLDHDVNDSQTGHTDPRGLTTSFTYNGFGEVVLEASPDRGTMTYTYDSRGLVTSMTDARGVTATYEYDDGGRLTAKRFPSSPSEDVTFTYDVLRNGGSNILGVGKIGTVRDEAGVTQTFYRNNGSVSQETRQIDGVNYVIKYNYDDEGLLRWVEYPSKRRVFNSFDVNNRTTKVRTRIQVRDPVTNQWPPMEIVTEGGQYKAMGPLRRLKYGDGRIHLVGFDKSYRLTRLRDYLGTDYLRDDSYKYDKRDDITRIIDNLAPGTEETFGYEHRGFMDSAEGLYPPLDFTYDAVGNRITKQDGIATDTYSYGATSNRLMSIAGANPRSFTYDAAGNTTYDLRNGTGHGYTYNAANRMSSHAIDGVVQAEYTYNAQGQQVIRNLTQMGEVIHNIFDLDGNRIAEYLYDAGLGTSTLIREYIWMDGRAVGVVEGGQLFYVRTDHIGRPVFATNDLGVKVWETEYLPFGGVFTSTGGIDLRFPGQWYQLESGLHQNWMRDYDPTTGRYIQADPLGLVDGASVYGYALQNPGRYVDPRGEAIPAFLISGAVGAVSGAVGAAIATDGCVDAIVIGAIAGGLAGAAFPNPTQFSSIGTLLGGASGSVGGQYAATFLAACSCEGISFPTNRTQLDEAVNRATFDPYLAAASGLGGATTGAVLRHMTMAGMSVPRNSALIGVAEGAGAGAAEVLYSAGTSLFGSGQ